MTNTRSIKAKFLTGVSLIVLSVAAFGTSIILERNESAKAIIHDPVFNCSTIRKPADCPPEAEASAPKVTIVSPTWGQELLKNQIVPLQIIASDPDNAGGKIATLKVDINKFTPSSDPAVPGTLGASVFTETKTYGISEANYILSPTNAWNASDKEMGFYKATVVATNALVPAKSTTSSVVFYLTDRMPTLTSTYEGQWVYSKILMLNMRHANNTTENPVAQIAVGPSEWQVRYCVNGKITDPNADSLTLGTCELAPGQTDGSMRTINETWSVMKWADPLNAGNVMSGQNIGRFNVKGTEEAATNENIEFGRSGAVNVGTCEGSGMFTRSGLYGVSFDEGSGCNGNYLYGWWSYSALPAKWFVRGTISQ